VHSDILTPGVMSDTRAAFLFRTYLKIKTVAYDPSSRSRMCPHASVLQSTLRALVLILLTCLPRAYTDDTWLDGRAT